METLKAENVRVYGISYDPIPPLKSFAEDYDVTYDLLSDFDSTVIKKFGILNTLVKPSDPEKHPSSRRGFYGVPFPGTYVVDENGVVIEKFFYRHYATRESAGSIVNTALGEILMPKESPRAELKDDHIKVTAFLADDALKLEYASMLYVRFELADGHHIYTNPLPEGFIATTVESQETLGLRFGEPTYPTSRQVKFEGLDATLNVFEGVTDIAIPITATKDVLNWNLRDAPKSIDVIINVRYQVCSDTVCFAPKTETLSINVPLQRVLLEGAKRAQ